ncbi:MAG TPA: cellulase family glycosylhydrolase, partial [Kofleriaceae bacterium]|nr:cellulase family glycosylhydrolase [Kofleriaceae bacterium]
PATTTTAGTSADTTTAGPGGSEASTGTSGGDLTGEWLIVQGNRIVHADGTPFHGRGANLHDERSCEACSFAPRNPDGLDRWADELIDNWHANFIRFDLSAKDAPYNEYEQQWENLVDDDAYFGDIVQNVEHMASKPDVYILVTLFADPTMKDNTNAYDSEWPSSMGDSNTRYTKLAETFADDPHVLFGLTNEPHTDFAGDNMATAHDAALATVYTNAIAAIRAVEDAHHVAHHVVVVQAPEGYARDLAYFVANPLAGDQIAYEIHPYNPQSDFDHLIVQPAQTLPVIIGEYGPAPTMTMGDVTALWTVAEANGVPYIAWNFHARCAPTLLVDNASDGCGLSASTGYNFPRTAYGDALFTHLTTTTW